MTFRGLDDLRDTLQSNGWKLAEKQYGRGGNGCNWYAYRRTALPAAECECNEGKPMQIVIEPYTLEMQNQLHSSTEVKVTGEAGGQWFDLKAYSIQADELPQQLASVEAALIGAWNALPRAGKEKA
jgi:hypothetical protein